MLFDANINVTTICIHKNTSSIHKNWHQRKINESAVCPKVSIKSKNSYG